MSHNLKQLADHIGAKLIGDGDVVIHAVASIENAGSGDICFVSSSKYIKALKSSAATAVIIRESELASVATNALVVNNPRAAYARLVRLLYPEWCPPPGIHPTAVIHPSAQISASAFIGSHVVIEENVVIAEAVRIDASCIIGRNSKIGKASHLYANVTVYHHCSIGSECILHAASVIGSDGFGFEFDQNEWLKIPQVGGVVIGNKVEIGACSVVDRGALNDTIIDDGVKLDNHVQIAHNVHVGAHTVMSRGVGVAGSAIIGKHCMIGGMAGIRDNIEITDNVIITAMTIVSKSLSKPGSYSSTTPIDETRSWRKNSVRFRQLDDMAKRIRQLEKKLEKKG